MTNMRLHFTHEHTVSIVTSRGLFDLTNDTLARAIGETDRLLMFADVRVLASYGEACRSYFRARNVALQIEQLTGGETTKSLVALERILDAIERFRPLRRERLVAVGGGTILDTVGLAAALFRRGIPYIRVPTTLVGLVDVSVATKVGINHFGLRNRLGAYYPPAATLIDPTFVLSLPKREISSGLGEILKLGVVVDKVLLALIEAGDPPWDSRFFDTHPGRQLIERSALQMARELGANPWETELQRAVDFGHTFSPLIEMVAVPRLAHGEAVGLDVLLSSAIAERRGHISSSDFQYIRDVAYRCGLPLAHPAFADLDLLCDSLSDVVLHRNGRQHLPVPSPIGACAFIEDLSREELALAVARAFAPHASRASANL